MQTHPGRELRIVHHLVLAAAPAAVTLVLVAGMSLAVGAATILSELWTAGGLSAGTDSAGQAARIASDASGDVAVVSGPSGGRDMAVTSYTADGAFRWRRTVSPSVGTFQGDWVAFAPNGDVVAVGHNIDSRGNPIPNHHGPVRLGREASVAGGPLGGILSDRRRGSWWTLNGNAYLAVSGRGTGAFVQKYSPSGALLWSRLDATGSGFAIASSLALSPDGDDVAGDERASRAARPGSRPSTMPRRAFANGRWWPQRVSPPGTS